MEIKEKLLMGISKTKFTMEKHSPEILAVIGTVGVVGTIVVASKATLKVNDILEESKDNIEKIHEVAEHPEKYSQDYTKEDEQKDLTTVYIQTGIALAKTYAPAIVLGTLSLGCLLSSNNILRKRNAALTAAYAGVDKAFKEYRGRVANRFGDAVEKEIRYNLRANEVDEVHVDENGNETVEKKTVHTPIDSEHKDPTSYSPYARCFDDGNVCWKPNADYNVMFLRQQQFAANQKLKRKGFLTLNEVYELLEFPPTKAGMVIGWVYDESKDNLNNFVDFGICDVTRPAVRDFTNGYEDVIWLDFNVDGDIYSLM